MTRRDDRIYEEVAALWRELYHEQPPRHADGAAMLDIITRRLPDTRYERLASPHMRPSMVSVPKSR